MYMNIYIYLYIYIYSVPLIIRDVHRNYSDLNDAESMTVTMPTKLYVSPSLELGKIVKFK